MNDAHVLDLTDNHRHALDCVRITFDRTRYVDMVLKEKIVPSVAISRLCPPNT